MRSRRATRNEPDKPKRRREEARRRFGRSIATGEEGPVAIRWNRGSVRPFLRPVGVAEAARLAHRPKEQQLVDLLERPARVARREAADEGGQVGRLSRRQTLHEQEAIDGASGRCRRASLLRLGLRAGPCGSESTAGGG